MALEKKSFIEQNDVDTHVIKCDACGSNMIFNPDTQSLSCEHCGSERKFDTSKFAQEQDILSGFAKNAQWKAGETAVFSCTNCGAKVVLGAGQTAKKCPFCATAHVQEEKEFSGIKPNAVIPFTIGDKKAIELSKAWARKRFFAPRKFKKNINAENVNGLYTPCFTFDSTTQSQYVGRIGKTHTRIVGSGNNRRVQTYTVWHDIMGTYTTSFDDIIVNASYKIDQKQLKAISPYPTGESKEYQDKYLYGYMAYHYDKDIRDCWDSAKESMEACIRRQILAQYSYDKFAYLNVSTIHHNATYKYVLLPVYVGNFTFRQKVYNFFVNGCTGKVKGKTPKSVWKILGTILIGCAIMLSIVLLNYYLK